MWKKNRGTSKLKTEDKSKALIRLKDADEFLASSEDNLEKNRLKASLDHAIDSVIAANDSFTIHLIGQVATYDHHEAIKLHKLAGQKITENKANEIASLLEERHRRTYRTASVTKNLSEITLKKAKRFIEWVKEKIKP